MDHRCGTRFNLSLSVELLLPDDLHRAAGCLVVASVTGGWVDTKLRKPIYSQVRLRPLATAGSVIEAYVVRSTDSGLALEWLETASEAVLMLLPGRAAPLSAAAATLNAPAARYP